ncbi:MAG: hypothetical protein GHCLOJNM_03158 [bacterium]|nr:hypothetical protein [bacterium]
MRILAVVIACLTLAPAESHELTFKTTPQKVAVLAEGEPLAMYVHEDERILRPYFCDLRALDGSPVTRNHPPVEGVERTDHAEMHPGVWMGFGDISGADFWRNKARVRHVRFLMEPTRDRQGGHFEVENLYEADGMAPCREICLWRFVVHPEGYFLIAESTFTPEGDEFAFGDQEEMGFGIRMATPLAVAQGGAILNSNGERNEKEAWGKQAEWCHYSGRIGEKQVGVILIPDPLNFRKSWFHVRDYGLLVANPFGQNAFTNGEKSSMPVKRGERFKLRFALYVHSNMASEPLVPSAILQEFNGISGYIDGFSSSEER